MVDLEITMVRSLSFGASFSRLKAPSAMGPVQWTVTYLMLLRRLTLLRWLSKQDHSSQVRTLTPMPAGEHRIGTATH